MRKLFTVFVLILTVSNAFADTPLGRKAFIIKYKKLAISEMKRTGVPASVTLAQAILESDLGTSELAKKANNFFGIKCHDWTGKTYLKDDDAKNECFRSYRKSKQSWIDHSNFLRTRDHYAFLFELETSDYIGWCHGLKKAGYATDPEYASKLIRIIEEEDLYLLDQTGKKRQKWNPLFTRTGEEKGVAVRSGFGAREQLINDVPCIIAEEGDSFEAIATYYDIPMRRLLRFNDKNEPSIRVGMPVFLAKKRPTAEKQYIYHEMKEGDDVYWLSQIYGIQYRALLELNYLLPGDHPVPGEKIYLQFYAPIN